MATTTQTSGWSISYQLVFCGGPHLLSLSLSPFPSSHSPLSFSLSHAHTYSVSAHTYTYRYVYTLSSSLYLLPAPLATQSAVSPSLAHSHLLSRASPSSLLLPSRPSCNFYPRFTILFVPRVPPKERQTLVTGVANLSLFLFPLSSYDTISFGHFGVRFHNLPWYTVGYTSATRR